MKKNLEIRRLRKAFRRCYRERMEKMKAYLNYLGQNIVGHSEFFPAWKKLIEDEDVQKLFQKFLFVPPPLPNAKAKVFLSQLLAQELGEGFEVLQKTYSDMVSTKAKIESCKISEEDPEGPEYRVTYSYATEAGEIIRHELVCGYDAHHAALQGWGRTDLNRHWRQGALLQCRYVRSEPQIHEIEKP